MLGLGLPTTAQAAEQAPQAVSAPSSNSLECYQYNYDHHGYHYYRYCYDYRYRSHSDQQHNKRWYESFELFYRYNRNGHTHYGSCTFSHQFGYHHPNSPWKSYCPSF
jgi:hypothetical protein